MLITMCSTMPVTEDSLAGSPRDVVGLQCPLCESQSPIGYMKFRDPHGVDRVDSEVFECAAQRHTYTVTANGLRVLAADGVRPKPTVQFSLNQGSLVSI